MAKATKQKAAQKKRSKLQPKKLILILIFALAGVILLTRVFASHQQRVTQTYSTFTWPETSQGYTEFEWSMTPMSDPSPQGFYWATDFTFKWSGQKDKNANHSPGYVGLQTSRSMLGKKAAVFSIWHAKSGSSTGLAKPFDHEGSGYQTMIPYDWKVGQEYKFKLRYIGQNGAKDRVWTATVHDVSQNVTQTIGTINVPQTWGGLNSHTGSWTEYFAGTITTCDTIPYTAMKFTNHVMRESNKPNVLPTKVTNTYEANQSCPEKARIQNIPGGTLQEIGDKKATAPSQGYYRTYK